MSENHTIPGFDGDIAGFNVVCCQEPIDRYKEKRIQVMVSNYQKEDVADKKSAHHSLQDPEIEDEIEHRAHDAERLRDLIQALVTDKLLCTDHPSRVASHQEVAFSRIKSSHRNDKRQPLSCEAVCNILRELSKLLPVPLSTDELRATVKKLTPPEEIGR